MHQQTDEITRGFVTIATGKTLYYQLATNLLNSYRLYTNKPCPFTIICDEENAYTSQFDQVILLEQPHRNYFDKFELLVRAPYDETIFIDSDCLAYGDLNYYWEYFSSADDFSAGGVNFPRDSDDGLFWLDGIGEYAQLVNWKPSIHGGLYFIRRGEVCDAIYEEYQNIMRHYHEFRWPDYCVDEPVFGLAMAVHGCRALNEEPENYIYPWLTLSMDCDIFTGKCTYESMEHKQVPHCRMIHWSVRNCSAPLYRFEVEKLNLMLKYGAIPPKGAVSLKVWERLLYCGKLRFYELKAVEFVHRVIRKLGRIVGLKISD